MALVDIAEEEIEKYVLLFSPYETSLKDDDAVLVPSEMQYLTDLGWHLQEIFLTESLKRSGLVEKIFHIVGKSRVHEMRLDSNAREAHVTLLREKYDQDISSEKKTEILSKIRELESDNYHY